MQPRAIAPRLNAIPATTLRAAILDSSLRNVIMIASPITASTPTTRYHMVSWIMLLMRGRVNRGDAAAGRGGIVGVI